MDRQVRNNSGYVEDKVRECAASMFGISTMKSFLVKSLHDLVILSSPHDYSFEDIIIAEAKLEEFAQNNFVEFIVALYDYLCKTVDDPGNILADNPWVDEDNVPIVDNIKACGVVLSNSQNALKKRILFAIENAADSIMSPFRRSNGPGLSIVVWFATSEYDVLDGEFLSEIEVDCRGKVDLLLSTNRAVVMGAEIKTSASAIRGAKRQLIRRFKIMTKCMNIIHGIRREHSIFIGRVFYRDVAPNSTVEQSEDGSDVNHLSTLSFYYHRVYDSEIIPGEIIR